jgi:type IV secretory pathway VirB3-like protein
MAERVAIEEGEDEPLAQHVLEAAATRPPMTLFITRRTACLLLCGFVEGMLLFEQWWYAFGFLFLWPAAKVLVSRDWNMENIVLVWLSTSARCLVSSSYRGATIAPLPVRMRRPYGVFADAA